MLPMFLQLWISIRSTKLRRGLSKVPSDRGILFRFPTGVLGLLPVLLHRAHSVDPPLRTIRFLLQWYLPRQDRVRPIPLEGASPQRVPFRRPCTVFHCILLLRALLSLPWSSLHFLLSPILSSTSKSRLLPYQWARLGLPNNFQSRGPNSSFYPN